MRIKTFLFLIIFVVGGFAIWGQLRIQDQMENRAYEIGLKAYEFAFPLVLTGTTREIMSEKTPINTFCHFTKLPTHQTKFIVRPNVDTLYSVAWIDLHNDAQVLSIPAMPDRYYIIEILDAWTEVVANPGTRTTGREAHEYLITGPNWRGIVPQGLMQIKIPTEMAWIIGRIQTNGKSDTTYVSSLQKNFTITPLAKWSTKTTPQKICDNTATPAQIHKHLVPVDEVINMSMDQFFTQFTDLLASNKPHPEDKNMVNKLAQIGIIPGKPFTVEKLSPAVIKGLERAYTQAKDRIKDPSLFKENITNGWRMALTNIGNYGIDYTTRAIIALRAIGANRPADAVYPTSFIDADGQILEGEKCYTIHFTKDQIPPVHAFWSITIYGPDDFLVKNRAQRYALGDRDKLTYNKDGSLDIHIQQKTPAKKYLSNWLPAPSQTFSLTARLYWPQKSVLNGSWHMPFIQRCKCK